MRLGRALEAAYRGQAHVATRRTGMLHCSAVYVGGETPFGPLHVGCGQSTSGSWNAYFFLGTLCTD